MRCWKTACGSRRGDHRRRGGKKEANAIKEEYEQNMQEAKAKANEILESARKTATLQSEKIVKEASEQAAALKTRQKKRLPRRKESGQ